HVPRSWPAAKPSSLTSLRRSPDALGGQRGLTSSKCFDGARSGRRGVVQSEVKEESRARARLGGHERRTAPRRPDPARPSSPSTATGRKAMVVSISSQYRWPRAGQTSLKTVTVMVWLCSSLTPPGTDGEISPYE